MRVIVRILAPIFLVLGLIGPAGVATAAPAQSDRFFTFAFDQSFCNGENIVGEGTMHIVSKVQNDGSVLERITVHAKGVGDQGNEYVMNWTQTRQYDRSNIWTTSHARAISKGSAPNQDLNATFNSATGEFVFEPVCHG